MKEEVLVAPSGVHEELLRSCWPVGDERSRRRITAAEGSLETPTLVVGIRVYKEKVGPREPHIHFGFIIGDGGYYRILTTQQHTDKLPSKELPSPTLDFLLEQIQLARQEENSLSTEPFRYPSESPLKERSAEKPRVSRKRRVQIPEVNVVNQPSEPPIPAVPLGDTLNTITGERGWLLRDEKGKPIKDADGLLTIEFPGSPSPLKMRLPEGLIGKKYLPVEDGQTK